MTPRPRPADLLTAVDLRLLEGLRTHRVLTTAQAAQVADVQLRVANYRLGRLRDAGLAERHRPYASSGGAPYHWWLTTAGRTRVGSPGRIRPRSTSQQFLTHTVATAAIPLALDRQGPQVGLRLVTWLRDEEAWESWATASGKERLTPDGYALVHVAEADATVPLLVEVDRATMPLRRLAEKVNRYLRYTARGVWQDRHPMCPVLLLLTTSEERARNTRAVAAAERPRILGPTGELLVAVTATVEDAEAAVTGPVWHIDHDGSGEATAAAGARTLAELLRYRISTEQQRKASELVARATVETAELHALGRRLAQHARTFNPVSIEDPVVADVLAALLRRDPEVVGKWAERHPVLVRVLTGWLAQPLPRGPLPTDTIAALREMHESLWTAQAAAASRAATAAAVGDPRLRRACRALIDGRLVPGWLLEGLANPRPFESWQADLLAEHALERAEKVAAELHRRPAWRRIPTVEQLAADFDALSLDTCSGCGLHHATARHGSERCSCCGDKLVEYDPALPEETLEAMCAFLAAPDLTDVLSYRISTERDGRHKLPLPWKQAEEPVAP